MKVIARELLFQVIGHLEEHFSEHPKDKDVAKLKLSVAKFLFPYRHNVEYDSIRGYLKMNSTDIQGVSDSLSIGLCCLFEALNYTTTRDVPIKLEKKWLELGLKLYEANERENRLKCRVANKVVAVYPHTKEDLE